MRVLVVEDHPTMRFGVSSLLDLAGGLEVVGEAADAGGTLRLVDEVDPDVVLLDLRLRDGPSGIELCREIKGFPDPPRVLVYTAYNSEDDVSSALLSGADGFLHKGLDHELLPDALRRTCEGEQVWLLGSEIEEAKEQVLDAPEASLLTKREREVLTLVLKRYTNAEISEALSISLQTTKNHVSSILRKLGKHSRRELF